MRRSRESGMTRTASRFRNASGFPGSRQSRGAERDVARAERAAPEAPGLASTRAGALLLEPAPPKRSARRGVRQEPTLEAPASVFTLHFGSRTLADDVAWAGLEDQAAF